MPKPNHNFDIQSFQKKSTKALKHTLVHRKITLVHRRVILNSKISTKAQKNKQDSPGHEPGPYRRLGTAAP